MLPVRGEMNPSGSPNQSIWYESSKLHSVSPLVLLKDISTATDVQLAPRGATHHPGYPGDYHCLSLLAIMLSGQARTMLFCRRTLQVDTGSMI
jgi:hypothetical protein